MTEAAPPDFDREAYRGLRKMVGQMIDSGARMIAIVARERDDGVMELIYVFDRDRRLADLRFLILPEWEIDSVADLYKGALTLEREIVDLFGLRIKGVRPGLFLVEGKSPVAPLRKRKAPAPGGDADG
ncbi:MAG: NADH-quinone oxidoreductase subunit C [Methanomassiliicoccus sp.]|nr:NADH-quinone oxidoreductase subunit C [Methanomassiliicoccus sp.]